MIFLVHYPGRPSISIHICLVYSETDGGNVSGKLLIYYYMKFLLGRWQPTTLFVWVTLSHSSTWSMIQLLQINWEPIQFHGCYR